MIHLVVQLGWTGVDFDLDVSLLPNSHSSLIRINPTQVHWRVLNLSKARLSFPWHVPGAVTLEYDALYRRLEEVPYGVAADGGEEAEEHNVPVQPRVHAELFDAARVQGPLQVEGTVLRKPRRK